MAKHDDINASSIDNPNEEWVANSIEEAMPPPLSSARIPKVLKILVSKGNDIYDEYYVPKVVSIGPYHYGNQNLELVEKLKPVFTKALLLKYSVGLRTLSKRLGEANMVQELRSFYEEKSTNNFTEKEFTKMMLLDGCFIVYYMLFIFGEKAGSCPELRSYHTAFIQQDLFLLENQIPFKVLKEVTSLIKLERREHDKIESFFSDSIGRESFGSGLNENNQYSGEERLKFVADHLLHRLHYALAETSEVDESQVSSMYTFRNVNELVDVGIHFKPSSVASLAHLEFVRRSWFSADVKLPQITVDDFTKTMVLNLIAYEMCADDTHKWVTSYVSLLVSLIHHPDDVKVLREAGVLINALGSRSDKDIVTLLKEIGSDLVPNDLAYSKAKYNIQRHYDIFNNTMYSKLKHEYIQQWSVLALVAAVTALFLSAVQTYFTVWDKKGECDDLCTFLKMNHHL